MSNDTSFDPNPLNLQLGPEYILIPFVGVTFFGLLASLGAYIRRQRTDLVQHRLRPQDCYSSNEYDSDNDSDGEEDLTEPLWRHDKDFREGSPSARLSSFESIDCDVTPCSGHFSQSEKRKSGAEQTQHSDWEPLLGR